MALADAPYVGASTAEHTGLSATAAFFFALLIFSVSALIALSFKLYAPNLILVGFSGTQVPDALSLTNSVHFAWTVDLARIPNIRTFLGTVLVYFPITKFGDDYAAMVNIVMLALASSLFNSTLRKTGLKNVTWMWFGATALVSSNFYVIFCIFYPNKEIPLVFLTCLFLRSAIFGNWPLAALLTFVCFWFRDGYGLVLAIVLSVLIVRSLANAPAALAVSTLFLLGFVAFPITYLSGVDSALQRNVELGSLISGHRLTAFGDVFAYFARLTGNALNLGIRPQILDVNGNVYLLGLGYWQFGLVLIAGLLASIRLIWSRDLPISILSFAILLCMFGISYGSFVQPRYMMPMIFPLALGFCSDKLARTLALLATTLLPWLFAALNLLPPLASG